MYKYITSLVILLFLFVGSSNGQQNVEFEKLSSERGVSQSIVYSIAQDKIGNIWMATEEGVVKYNSNYSIIFNKYKGLPNDIGSRVNKIFISSKGKIFLGVDTGVCVYDEILDKFEKLYSKKDLGPTLVKSFTEDVNGRIWIGAYNGLWKLNEETTEFEKIQDEISNKKLRIQVLCSGPKNKIVLGTESGLHVYDYSSSKFIAVPKGTSNMKVLSIIRNKSDYLFGTLTNGLFKIDNRFSSVQKMPFSENFSRNSAIRLILKEKGGNIYVGTDGGGIYYLNNDYKVINHFSQNEDNVGSLSSNGVYDILIDKEEIIWVATYGGGVNYLDKSKSVFKKIKHKLNVVNSLKNNFSRSIEVDKYGKIWFGTKNGVSVWKPESNEWKHIPRKLGIVLALEQDDDYMWVGSYNKGVFKININTLKVTQINKKKELGVRFPKVYSIFKDSKANIWVGGIRKDLVKIFPNQQIQTFPIKDVKSIVEKKSGEIIVSGRYGVHYIHPEENKLLPISSLDNRKKQHKYFTINSVDFRGDDKMVLATNGSGLLFYDFKTEKIKKLNVKNGMPSDIVQGVVSLSNQELWASTTKGMAQIKMSDKDTIIHVFDKNDGLASTEHNYGSFKKINDELLAFGGTEGVTLFNPKKVKSINTTPIVTFEDFSIYNKVISPQDDRLKGHINTKNELQLAFKDNSITFSFIGVLHNSTSKIKYTWKLEGLNDEWSSPSKNTQVNFTNLDSGDYVFKVKAANKFNEWGEERSINIKISAPWWATTTAYIIYFILIVLLFVITIYFTQLIVNKNSADEQIEFFNNLTHEIRTPLTILLSSLETVGGNKDSDSNNQVKKTITRLNALFEQMLNFKKATSASNLLKNVSKISLGVHVDELTGNFKPLSNERNIDLTINNRWSKEVFYFDKETLNKILFNLISNAIKYTKEGGSISVNLSENSKKELLIEVVDTGIGIPKDQQKFILKRFYRARNVINSQKPGTGLGLMMVKSLVEKSHGSISFTSEENIGTTFSVVIPNQDKYYKDTVVLDENFQQDFEINEQTDINEFSDRKILIVEDNDELRTLLSKSLGTYLQVYEASNGKEGLEMAGQIFPDIILTDLIMPEMDGMQMAKELLEDINLNHIPVFMMTVLNNSELKIESIESGISEYIEKPLDINLLLAKITNTLSWQNKLREKFIHQSEKNEAIKYRNSKDEQFVTNLENILFGNIENTSFSVHELCESVGMSRTSLYMKLKNLIDLSPQDFIIHTKLKFAKNLLIKGGLTIKEVAYQSGFSNPKYFSTSFKKFYGVSPSGFVESLQKKDI
jgi:signal transduction histidine kinase/ligand-binding sensor domain-containing protein/AraC-like DNA-binding protein